MNAALALLLVGLTVATAQDRRFAAWFCAAALGTLVLFRLGGAALTFAAARAPTFARPWARLGIANLHRPGASAPLMLVSLGLGLSTLAAVALIEGNVRRELTEQMPRDAPSFFFIDIQNDQLDALPAARPRGAGGRERAAGAEPARPHRGGERRARRPGEGDAETRAGRSTAIAA